MERAENNTALMECQERFKAIFSLTSAATKIIDHNLVIIEVNDALVKLLGFPANEICGTKIMDFACEEYISAWHDLQEAMWKHDKPFFKIDACLKRKDGRLAWVHVTTIKFHESGKDYAYSVLDDYSYKKEYQESQKRLEMSLEHAQMAVWEMDMDSGEVAHSNGLPAILGLGNTHESTNRNTVIDCFLEEDAALLENQLIAGKQGDIDFTGRLKTKGEVKWINLKAKSGTGPSGQNILLGTAHDVTEEKLANRYKDDFISIASHELKTPVTVLSGSLQLLERVKHLDPKLSGLIRQANKSMVKVNSLINDLLNASRMNEGQLHLNYKMFNLNEAFRECCANLDEHGKFNLIIECDPSLGLLADSERIQQVVVNFISNAIKYAPDGKDIILRGVDEGENIKISVIDSGPGIEENKIQHLFDRYYRVDAEGSQYSGLGLGLYISSEIIKKHGGEIGAESTLGQGTEFWVRLPKVGS